MRCDASGISAFRDEEGNAAERLFHTLCASNERDICEDVLAAVMDSCYVGFIRKRGEVPHDDDGELHTVKGYLN